MIKQKQQKKKGQSLVEYGLILALVSVVAIAVLQAMGGQIENTLQTVRGTITEANSAAQTAASLT